MRRLWTLLGVAMLAAVLAIGAVACDDDDNGDNGATPPATEDQAGDPTQPADQPAPTVEGEEPENGDEPANGDTATVVVTDGILTDASGNTLYIFDNDEAGISNCTEGCLDLWPPLLVTDGATAGEGVPGTLSTITRPDGTTQVTHDDLPLYYYADDTAPGDRNGDGFGGVWHIVSAE